MMLLVRSVVCCYAVERHPWYYLVGGCDCCVCCGVVLALMVVNIVQICVVVTDNIWGVNLRLMQMQNSINLAYYVPHEYYKATEV